MGSEGRRLSIEQEGQTLVERLGGRWTPGGGMCRCPAHDDRTPSLSVRPGRTRLLLHCFAGCEASAILRAFESANRGLRIGAAGTAVVARLTESEHRDWTMTWTNAGHPAPILLLPDGRLELLLDHDALFGFSLTASTTRRDHRRDLPPGSTLFLYTDGLIERRGSDIDAGTEALARLLRRIHDRPVHELVNVAVDTLAADAPDDVVAFAIRFPLK